MHDKIFANYNSLNDEKLKGFAQELGLNMLQFETDRNDASSKQRIRFDLQNGIAAGVHGTPAIFINGHNLHQRTLEGFIKMIDRELQQEGNKQAQSSD